MYSYFNPNPCGNRVGDCVIRAISKALNQAWEDTYIELTIQGYIMGDLLSSNAVWGAYLKSKGFAREIVSNDCPECYTINDFCNEYPQGVFVIGTGTHAVAVINGIIFDTWNSGDETPIYYYKKGE
ncbi:MAG: hypothetical protein IKV64_01645 [Clostridia bacterium]|nr:hypothetical protein [Clostridia bacterium]